MAASRAMRIMALSFACAAAVRVDPAGPEPRQARAAGDPLPLALVRHLLAFVPPLVAYTDSTSILRFWPRGIRSAINTSLPIVEAFFLPGGESLVTMAKIGFDNGEPTVWRWRSRSMVSVATLHHEVQSSAAFPDGERVASVSVGGHVAFIWGASCADHVQLRASETRFANIEALHVLHPGDRVLTEMKGAFLRWRDRYPRGVVIWDASSGQVLQSWDAQGDLTSVEVSPCGEKVLVADSTPQGLSVSLRDSRTGEVVFVVTAFPDLSMFRVSQRGARVVAASEEAVFVWDTATTALMMSITPLHVVDAFTIDHWGRRIFVFGHSADSAVNMLWDVDTGVGVALERLDSLSAWWRTTAMWTKAQVTATVSNAGDVVAVCHLVTHDWEASDSRHDKVKVTAQIQVWHVASARLLHSVQNEYSRTCDVGHHSVRTAPCSITISYSSQDLVDSLVM